MSLSALTSSSIIQNYVYHQKKSLWIFTVDFSLCSMPSITAFGNLIIIVNYLRIAQELI